MKYFITLTLAAGLSISTLHAAEYDQFVEIKEGHYAKISEHGVLTEVATTGDAVLDLNKEVSDDYTESVRETVLTKQKAANAFLCDVETFQRYSVTFSNDNFSVYGETHAHYWVGSDEPSELLYYKLRTKVKIVSFNAKGIRIGKRYFIIREEGGLGSSPPHAYASVEIPLDSNIKSIRWVVRSDIVVDDPDTLNATVLSERDCYATQMIKTSGKVIYSSSGIFMDENIANSLR
ncbi:MAG: hypothetical protein L3J88_09990 [Gammaproteobacteria bacterium]|nr:hypothetical protein [Gammaproteobacteria bacterium]MCF6363652.1 hypothetical protein [Gammaproteobacteria bacterium]